MNNITVCLYSTTRGHWGRKDCYLKTIQDLNSHGDIFSQKLAHIKVSPGEEDFGDQMEFNFKNFGFEVIKTIGEWKHFSGSHSVEQLKDIFTLTEKVIYPYIFHLEDDFYIKPINNSLSNFLNEAKNLLNKDDILQVRIPRFESDFEHYKSLDKIGSYFRQGEIYSLNPNLVKLSDLQIILNSIAYKQDLILPLLEKQQLNVELLFAQIGRQLKGEKPFWSFDGKNIRALHIGTKEGEEDKLPV